MAKKATSKTRNWTLFDGVGFEPDAGKYRERGPAIHHVVLMQSLHSGTDVYGPFLSEAAAHEWIRTEGENELYGRFDRVSVPGVSFHVEWMIVPRNRNESE